MTARIYDLFPVPLVIDENIKLDTKESKIIFDYASSLGNFRSNWAENRTGNFCSNDTFFLEHTPKLKKDIEDALKKFNTNVTNQKDLSITQSWVNVNPPGSVHTSHSHSNSIVSGVFYLQTNKETGDINFYKPVDRCNTFNNPTDMDEESKGKYTCASWHFTPPNNSLFLFPSNLSHSVNINKSTINRISLSFNTFFTGSFGNEISLTYVDVKRLRGNA